jgi:hypothetical protein
VKGNEDQVEEMFYFKDEKTGAKILFKGPYLIIAKTS